MLLHDKLWILKEKNINKTKEISNMLGVSNITSQLIINKGISSVDEAKAFVEKKTGTNDIETYNSNDGLVENNNDSVTVLEIEMELNIKDIGFKLIEDIKTIEHLYFGNPKPLFLCKKVTVENVNFFGEDNEHIKLLIEDENRVLDCIGKELGKYNRTLSKGEKIDLVFSFDLRRFKGIETIELNLVDIRRRCEDSYNGNTLIRNYYKSFPNIVYKSSYECKERALGSIVDLRNTKNRAEYIAKNIDLNNSNLILINTIEGLIGFVLSLSDSNRLDILNSISFNAPKNNYNNIVVVNPILSDFDFAKYDNIYVYDIPIIKNEIDILLSCGKKVHFLYSEKDIKSVKGLLSNVIPNRNDLADIYKHIKQYLRNKEMFSEEIEKIFSDFNYAKANLCLGILSDASLINYKENEEKISIELLPQPKNKIDINNTNLFKKIMSVRDDFKSFSKEAFTIQFE